VVFIANFGHLDSLEVYPNILGWLHNLET